MSFREVKAEELTMNPFTKIGKEWLLITAGNEEKCNTMTASWGAMGVMWGKNAVTVYILSLIHIFSFFMLQEYYSSSDNIKKSSGKGSMSLKNYFIQEKEQKTHEYF